VAAVYRFASAAEKTEFIVVNYENPLLYNSVDHFTSSWDGIDGEIVAVFRIFREMKRVLPTLVDAASVDPATMSPSAVGAIMSALNYSNLSSDAVPNLVRDAFASISFAEYTENNEEYYLTPKTYDLLDLDTMDYSDTDFTDVNPPELVGGIGLIRELMEGFYEGDGLGYYDMGLDFDIVDFIVTNGKSSVPIFHLLKSSNVFAPIVDTKTYKTRSLTLYNLLDPIDITKWIDFTTAGTNKDTKSQKLEDIFTTDFDYQFEGDRMDDYIGVVTQFTNPAYDASNINGFGDEFKSIITFTYSLSGDDIVDRAYLASELSAGFYTDIFEDEYAKVTPNPTVIDFYGNDYGNLNPIEADGVHGSLALIDVFAAIGADPLTAPDYLDDLQLYFTEMGSKAHTLVTGGLYPTAYNYTNWTAEGNSLIACIFYAAEVVPSAEYAQFHALMVTAAWNNHTTVVSLDVNPYDTNFVFEIQSDKITYSFTA
jgi:hypothetical protein